MLELFRAVINCLFYDLLKWQDKVRSKEECKGNCAMEKEKENKSKRNRKEGEKEE